MSENEHPFRSSPILIVDDDGTILKFFKIHLNKQFARVFVTKSAKEALSALKDNPIDLVITDISMPKIDGFQLTRKIKKMDCSIPVMLISGAILNEQDQKSINEADGFLRKPFSIEELDFLIRDGFELRVKLKELKGYLSDSSRLEDVLKNHALAEKYVKGAFLSQAQAILASLPTKNS